MARNIAGGNVRCSDNFVMGGDVIPADLDPLYIEARRILLNALEALAPHIDAVIVVGAQAVYLRTGEAEIAVAPYTTDGDLAIDPSLLGDEPELETAMTGANFTLSQPGGRLNPGTWVATAQVAGSEEIIPVDLIVPQAVMPGSGRGARLAGHGKRAARKVPGIEAVLVDHSPMTIAALDPADSRSLMAEVAGPAALLIAKAHKLRDRIDSSKKHRLDDKDAADVIRLMQTTQPADVGATMAALARHEVAGESTMAGLHYLDDLFGRRGREGIEMAKRALAFGLAEATIETLTVSYMARLRDVIGPAR